MKASILALVRILVELWAVSPFTGWDSVSGLIEGKNSGTGRRVVLRGGAEAGSLGPPLVRGGGEA